MILRLSERLAKKIQAGECGEMALDHNPIADWSCRLFVANRTGYIIVSNTISMYSYVMSATEVTDRDCFVNRLRDSMSEFLKADEQQHVYQRLVAEINVRVIFAKSLNRLVTESMSDQVHGSKLYLSDGLAPCKIGFRLNNTRLTTLTDSNGRRNVKPRDVFLSLANNMLD